jgi:hypothetical protein
MLPELPPGSEFKRRREAGFIFCARAQNDYIAQGFVGLQTAGLVMGGLVACDMGCHMGGVVSCRWDLGPEAVYARRAAGKVPQNYSYEAPVRAGAVVQATVTTVKANVTVPYSGNLTVTLASSAVISIPVTGVFEGESYTPLVCSPPALPQKNKSFGLGGCPPCSLVLNLGPSS